MQRRTAKYWVCPTSRLRNLDATKARDLVVECFYQAQSETFQAQKERMGMSTDEEAVRKTVLGAVRAAFAKAGGDFDYPTRESLSRAVDALALSAASWGTPREIIEHHKAQIATVLDHLPE